MNKLTGMHVFQSFEQLVDNEFFVNFLQNTCPDYNVQVCLHKIKHEIEVLIILGFDYVDQSNYIIVAIELLKKHDLSECSLGICGIVKGIENLFQGDNTFQSSIDCFPDDAVSSFTQFLDDLVFFQNMGFYLLSHFGFLELFICIDLKV